jgi:hypothetical protein
MQNVSANSQAVTPLQTDTNVWLSLMLKENNFPQHNSASMFSTTWRFAQNSHLHTCFTQLIFFFPFELCLQSSKVHDTPDIYRILSLSEMRKGKGMQKIFLLDSATSKFQTWHNTFLDHTLDPALRKIWHTFQANFVTTGSYTTFSSNAWLLNYYPRQLKM